MARGDELAGFRYVLLATHCIADGVRPLQSAIILSRTNRPDPTQPLLDGKPTFDGRLSAEEVLRDWRLDAELVTLSGCRSGLGKPEIGEGFIGFSQSFLLAGSRSVCVSLWKTDDGATALLMSRFHANLLGARDDSSRRGAMGKAEALAEAKTWLRTLPPSQALASLANLTGGVARGDRPLRLSVPRSDRTSNVAEDTDPPYAASLLLGRRSSSSASPIKPGAEEPKRSQEWSAE